MEDRFKISYKNRATPTVYKEVLDFLSHVVEGKFSDTAFRWSFNGVPHLLLESGGMVYSLCFFKKNRLWRVFYPYMTESKTKVDFSTYQEAISFILKPVSSTV